MTTSVYLLREPQPGDPFERAFRLAGFGVRSIPVLDFEFVNQSRIADAVRQTDRYGGMVLTSPRAVEALEAALREESALIEAWRPKRVFAVGPRTAQAIRELGLEPFGENSGSAQPLARTIVDTWNRKRLLFLSGDRRRDDLPHTLERSGVSFDEITCYRTSTRHLQPAELLPEPGWAAFFSPSGVEALPDDVVWHRTRIAAIGPTTEQALIDAGWKVHAIATSPEPESLVSAVLAAGKR